MKDFRRVFKYVWPQWPRLVVILVTAMLTAILFSLSFMTIIPLLKVMMNEEGLHSWVDRKVCDWRYGVDFYVPEIADFADSNEINIAYHLRIVDVEENSPAQAAGLKPYDRIVGVGDFLINVEQKKVASAKLFEVLATADKGEITVQLMQINGTKQVQLNTDLDNEFNTGVQAAVKEASIDIAQWAVSFMPREEAAAAANKKQAVGFIILLMVVVTVVRCIARFSQTYIAEKVVQVAIAGLREDAFAHVMDIPIGFFSSEGTSDTISRLLGDTSVTGNGVKILLGKTLRELLKALSCLLAAMWISYKLTLIFLCCAPATVILLGLLGKKIKKATKRFLMSTALMLGKLEGAINALCVVKVYNRQEYEHLAYHRINRTFLKQKLRAAKVDAAANPIMEVLGMFAGSAALLVGISWMMTSNEMEPSMFFGLIFLLGTAADAVRKVSGVWNKIQQANAASERVFAVVDEPVEEQANNAFEIAPLKNKIEFVDIVFTYPGADKPVLKGVNLSVQAGHNIALVGPNGSGKTTLANLIPRFYDPDAGRIIIDGKDIRNATLFSLRSQIGMVTQNVMTFNDTIAANIAYGKPSATREEIVAAAKRSFAHEFIEPLPDGYDTIIGEQGAGLSGGQLQRIIIARAIVGNPAILIFDEATSQVDADSEAKIHNAIEEIMRDRTTFIIAHRFSTVITADVIVVMDEGRIIAQGQHAELIQTCPLYQSLYETQLVKT